MAVIWMISSGIFGALSNLCLRQIMDKEGSSRAFFSIQLILTCLVTILLHPVRSGIYHWNPEVALLGLCAGFALGGMKWMIEKALERGPAGLTFAAVNAASVMPAIVMVFLIGSLIDFSLKPLDLIGLTLVVIGLFWAVNDNSKGGEGPWILFSTLAFILHLFFLLTTKFRALFVQNDLTSNPFWFIHPENLTSEWFVPMIFFGAATLHGVRYYLLERRLPIKQEFFLGATAGLVNGISMFLFMYGIEKSSLQETSYIFSVSSISLIIACNLWGQWLYRETINWKANLLCLLGIFIAAR